MVALSNNKKRVLKAKKMTAEQEAGIREKAKKNANPDMLCEKAVLASLSISLWTARKHDKKVTKEVDEYHGTKSAGRYHKTLMVSKLLEDIQKNAANCRLEHYRLTKPWMDEGPRVLPTELLSTHSQMIKEARERHFELVDEIHFEWDAMLREARKRLNGLFDKKDYPSKDTIRSKFAFEVKLLPIPAAGDFRIEVGTKQMELIKRDLEEHMREVMITGNHDTRDRIIDVVGHMAEKLRAFDPDAEDRAERGIFHASLVDNVRKLVEVLPAFNMSSDKKLDKIITRMAKELCADEAITLRENEGLRDAVAQSAESILAEVEKYLG